MSNSPTSLFHCKNIETGAEVTLPYRPEGPYLCQEFVPLSRLKEAEDRYQAEHEMKVATRRQRDILVSRLHRAVALCYDQGVEWDSDAVRVSRNYAKHCGDLIDKMVRIPAHRDTTVQPVYPWLFSDIRAIHGDGGVAEEAFYAGYDARLPRLKQYDLWLLCNSLVDQPQVLEAMRTFSEDPTADNGVSVITAIYEVLLDAPNPQLPRAPEDCDPSSVAGSEYGIGDYVTKHTGDYNISGEVRSAFHTSAGALRYVVEHKAEGGGSFLHIYGGPNLKPAERAQEQTCAREEGHG